MIYWPTELPAPLIGTTYNPVDPQIRTTMQSGRTLARRKFTVVPVHFQARWIFRSDAQAALFEDFYRVVTTDGAEWFAMPLLLPQGRDYRSLRFIGPYSGPKRVNHPGADGDFWEYSAVLELSQRPSEIAPQPPPDHGGGGGGDGWDWRPDNVPENSINILKPPSSGGLFTWSLDESSSRGVSFFSDSPPQDGGGLYWEKYSEQLPFEATATTNILPNEDAFPLLQSGKRIWVLIETQGNPSPVRAQNASIGVLSSGVNSRWAGGIYPVNEQIPNEYLYEGVLGYSGSFSGASLAVTFVLYGSLKNNDKVRVKYIGVEADEILL